MAAWLHEYARVVRVCARMRGSCTAYMRADRALHTRLSMAAMICVRTVLPLPSTASAEPDAHVSRALRKS